MDFLKKIWSFFNSISSTCWKRGSSVQMTSNEEGNVVYGQKLFFKGLNKAGQPSELAFGREILL